MILKDLSKRLLLDDAPSDGGGGASQATTLTADQQKIASAISKAAAAEPADTGGDKPRRVGQVIKPAITTPPPEALEGDFTLDDSDAPLEIDTITPSEAGKVLAQQKAEKAKAEADKKAKEEADAKVKADAAAKAGTKPSTTKIDVKAGQSTATTQTNGEQRDYTGYTAEEAALGKQMSNAAWQLFDKRTKEVKQLQQKGAASDNYYQHPEAYTLTPEYRESVQRSQLANVEARHWEEQLLNIRNGKPWTILRGFDKNNQPVYDGPYKPTDRDEIAVQNALTQSSTAYNQFQMQQQQMAQGFTQKVQADTQAINQEMAGMFEWVADPAKLKEIVPVEGVNEQVTVERIKDDFKALVPAYHRNNVMTDFASNLFASLQIYANEIRELRAKVAAAEAAKEEVVRAEPNIAGDGVAGKAGEKELVFDGEPI